MEKIKLKLEEGVELPQYETEDAVGFDLRVNKIVKAFVGDFEKPAEKLEAMRESFKKGRLKLRPGERVLFGTGIYADIPNNMELQIRSRSGAALKSGLVVVNSPGTIDPDYTGEICVAIYNASQFLNRIEFNSRVAQAVPKEVIRPALEQIEEITKNTERGEGGFGSTGV